MKPNLKKVKTLLPTQKLLSYKRYQKGNSIPDFNIQDYSGGRKTKKVRNKVKLDYRNNKIFKVCFLGFFAALVMCILCSVTQQRHQQRKKFCILANIKTHDKSFITTGFKPYSVPLDVEYNYLATRFLQQTGINLTIFSIIFV